MVVKFTLFWKFELHPSGLNLSMDNYNRLAIGFNIIQKRQQK